jgi:allantoate deiminase
MTRVDPVGNLVGRVEGSAPGAKTLLLGSHLDTVRDAGKYDGPLGVLLPIVALSELRRRDFRLPFAVEVVGFSEEEGVRFASGYLGSRGFAGKLRPTDLKLRDERGVTVGEALRASSGGRFRLPQATHRRRDLLGYVEVHIEQGPVLEKARLATGVVSAIAGQSRFKLTWTGRAGHAGTTPMNLRRDAFAGVAEFAAGVEKLARERSGLVATIGSVAVSPGAANVIPGQAMHTLDVRHASDPVRRAALLRLGKLAAKIAAARGLRVRWQRTQENGAVACAPALTRRLERSVRAVQGRCRSLVSGAGHDGVVVSNLTPIAMLFVRCRGGVSHHPSEFVASGDLAVALRVMVDFLENLATDQPK